MTNSRVPKESIPKPATAVVLAGGLGTRLRETHKDEPKVLAYSAGRPFLDYLLTYLCKQGITEIILSIGYKGAQVREYAGDGSNWSVKIEYCQENKPLGTGGALRLAIETLTRDIFFAFNGDTLFDVDLQRLWAMHQKLQVLATIALLRVSTMESHLRGCVKLANNGKILSFDEKPDSRAADPREQTMLISGGVYLLSKEALTSITPGSKASIERDIFPSLAQNGLLAGIVEKGYFADIGTPESLDVFEHDIIHGVVPDDYLEL